MTNTGAVAVCTVAILCVDLAEKHGLLPLFPAVVLAGFLYFLIGRYISRRRSGHR
jgi:hypothetical protein